MYVASTHALTHTHYSYTQAGKHVRACAHTHARTHATLGGVISTASERVFAQREALLRRRAGEFITYLFFFQRALLLRELIYASFLPSSTRILSPNYRATCVTVAPLNPESRVLPAPEEERENRSRLIDDPDLFFSPPSVEVRHRGEKRTLAMDRGALSACISLSGRVYLAVCDTCA